MARETPARSEPEARDIGGGGAAQDRRDRARRAPQRNFRTGAGAQSVRRGPSRKSQTAKTRDEPERILGGRGRARPQRQGNAPPRRRLESRELFASGQWCFRGRVQGRCVRAAAIGVRRSGNDPDQGSPHLRARAAMARGAHRCRISSCLCGADPQSARSRALASRAWGHDRKRRT
jgi:hypothetical protein